MVVFLALGALKQEKFEFMFSLAYLNETLSRKPKKNKTRNPNKPEKKEKL
jgi:hypothetical protein